MTSERLASRPTTSIAADAGTSSAVEDELDCRERRAARERRQRPQAPLVVGEQQLVAPSDRRLERSAAFRLAARRIAQHVEAIVEAAGDLFDRQRLGSRRRELDRQREPVERTAEVVHRVARRVGASVLALRRGARRVNSSTASASGEWRELEQRLAVDVEWHLAGAQDP